MKLACTLAIASALAMLAGCTTSATACKDICTKTFECSGQTVEQYQIDNCADECEQNVDDKGTACEQAVIKASDCVNDAACSDMTEDCAEELGAVYAACEA